MPTLGPPRPGNASTSKDHRQQPVPEMADPPAVAMAPPPLEAKKHVSEDAIQLGSSAAWIELRKSREVQSRLLPCPCSGDASTPAPGVLEAEAEDSMRPGGPLDRSGFVDAGLWLGAREAADCPKFSARDRCGWLSIMGLAAGTGARRSAPPTRAMRRRRPLALSGCGWVRACRERVRRALASAPHPWRLVALARRRQALTWTSWRNSGRTAALSSWG
jgi:hypothetical protein